MMGKVKKLSKDLDIVHCEKLEGGGYRFWCDRTFKNFLERIAWETS